MFQPGRTHLILAMLLGLAAVLPAAEPSKYSLQVQEGLPLSRASVHGKYRRLLRVISVPADRPSYTDFNDWGYYTGTEWSGHKNLPAGHWVYVYPRWYIWGDKTK